MRYSTSFWIRPNGIGGYEFSSPSDRDAVEYVPARDCAAMAAHLERLHKATLDAIFYLPGGEIKAELRDAYDDTPEISLTRLKAQWQADAVSEFAFHHLGGHEQEVAEIYASKLRRQAEGGEV